MPYMTFDRLQETINLQKALSDNSHRRSVEVLSRDVNNKKVKSNGVYIVRKT